jgi:pimeloyl-ACP methyl ester carboxylesterase
LVASAADGILPPALVGERLFIAGPAGRLNLYVAGEGAPLLLIHSINAAASAAEVRPLHEYYRRTRRVFSLDLPGYGLSDRPDLPYSPRHMTDAVIAATTEITRRTGHPQVDALALSLSCEYLARAAVESPQSFRSIALVSPTGFKGGVKRRGSAGSTLGMPWLHALLRGPGSVWGRSVFRQLTRPAVIRYFLERTWGSKDVDAELCRYDVITARQPGAEYAPLRFLSGFLFSRDIHDFYERLTLPVWMSHGVRGDFTDYGSASMVADRPNWRLTVYQTGALPQFEVPAQFCHDYDAFLDGERGK